MCCLFHLQQFVFHKAHLLFAPKLYPCLTANPQVRAQRRADEMRAKGMDVNIDEVMKNLLERDHIDSTREASPLTQAPDAIVLDNSYMTMDEQLEWLKKLISEKFGC